MININMGIGENIKKLMKERNVSAREVSRRTGIPQSSISDFLNSVKNPSSKVIIQLADFFDVTTDEILRGKKPELKSVASKETDALETLMSQVSNGFVPVASGIYRISIEKLVDVKKK
jgi:transcriptional regulator with XRE-family HTH domain